MFSFWLHQEKGACDLWAKRTEKSFDFIVIRVKGRRHLVKVFVLDPHPVS